MHRVLERQIKRFLGEGTKIPPDLAALLNAISDTYVHFDEDRALLDRSLELSSKEFEEFSQRLREAKQEVERQIKERTEGLEKYQTLVDNLSVGVYRNTPGPQGHFLEANPAIVSMFEAGSKEEFMGHNVSDFYQDPVKRNLFVEKIMKNGFVKNEELELVTLKGKKIIGSVSAVMKKNNDGTMYFDGIIEDITDRKRIEDALKKTRDELEIRVNERTYVLQMTNAKLLSEINQRKKIEEQMRLQTAALDAAASSIVITDTRGNIEWVNPAFTKLTGYTVNEAVGESTRILHSGKQDKSFYQHLWNTISSGQVWLGELVNRRKDGSLYTEEQIITPVKNANGEITHYIAIKQDVTERKLTDEKLIQSNKELEDTKKGIVNVLDDLRLEKDNAEKEKAKDEAILASIGDGMIAMDSVGKVMFMNKVAELLTGWKQAEVKGKLWVEVMPIMDEHGQLIAVRDHPSEITLLTGQKVTVGSGSGYYFLRRNQTKFPIAVTASPIMIGGKVQGVINIFRDITHERDIDQAKSEFVSLASHQLRTPLSAINWYTEMLLDGDAGQLNSEQRKYMEEVYHGNQRMVDLVNALLQVSRLELGTFAIEPQPVILSEIARSVLDELKPQILAKKLTVTENFQSDVAAVLADPKLVRIIIQNIFSNAVKYTPVEGCVNIEISTKDQGDASMKISDTGCGIPISQQTHIFTKLFRADNVKVQDTEGTGLGLYIVKSILDHAGGKIWFESVENKGTTFYITLPRGGMPRKEGMTHLI